MEKQLLFLNHLQQNRSDLINYIEIDSINKSEHNDIITELLELKLIRVYKYTICLTVKGELYLESLRSEILPLQKPYVINDNDINIYNHIGTFIVKMWNKDWFKLFTSGVMALIFGTWICIKIGLLK